MRSLVLAIICLLSLSVSAQKQSQQYRPNLTSFICENGENRYTRALYGSPTDWRLETSDRPIFAVVKKGHHRSVRFVVNGVPLDSTDYCRATYKDGMRYYVDLKRNGRLPEDFDPLSYVPAE